MHSENSNKAAANYKRAINNKLAHAEQLSEQKRFVNQNAEQMLAEFNTDLATKNSKKI